VYSSYTGTATCGCTVVLHGCISHVALLAALVLLANYIRRCHCSTVTTDSSNR